MVCVILFLFENSVCFGVFNLMVLEFVMNKMFFKVFVKLFNWFCLFNVLGFVMKVVMGELLMMIFEG